jgi:glycosyltransferase involved in cell wall biosynthesis
MPLYCRKADAVICFAQAVKRDLVRLAGIDPGKLSVIPQAPHPRFGRVTDPAALAAVRAKYRLPERFLFFISGITPLKNLRRILRAYGRIKDRIPHDLVMAGFGRWKYESEVHLIDTLGLGDRVIKLGYLPDEEVPVFMSLADALVFPSLYEGLGIPILEAQACGCPVLASTRGAAPETSGGVALLVDPFSVDEIASAMERIAIDTVLRAELSERGLAEAQHRSWEATARKLWEIFQAVGA